MLGKKISHYKILEKLGEGGMGVVYKAEDIKLGRYVVLKFLPPDLTRDPTAKARFINEAKAASALDHPNVCTIHEIGETDDGQLFICMAYYEGETLREKVARLALCKVEGDKLQVASAIDIATQVAQGLESAHEAGMTHRDIKPGNIMITQRGEVKILDFGLAKLARQKHLTKAGTMVGTVDYMSPEQAQGKEINHQTDIWSLGVVLYEMITGQSPFKGDYDQAVIYAIANLGPRPITELRTDVPSALEDIVNKCLTKNPADRYQRVDEMLVDLRSVTMDLESGKAKKRSTRARVPKRKRTLPFVVVTALVILFVVAVYYLLIGDKQVIDSIAVLPLKNLSGDPEQVYFVDGMHEELIARLAEIEALTVISRTSVMQYKEVKKPLPEIARELNVEAVIEGTVRWAGDRVRITVQLIDAAKDRHIWANTYERDLTNILMLQSEVTQDIAREIQAKLTSQAQLRLVSAELVNPEAYKFYLRGRYHWNKRTPLDFEKALENFRLSIDTDPAYALAYAGLADCYGLLSTYTGVPPLETMPKAKAAANQALEIEENLAVAHASLGWARTIFDYDWVGAEREYQRALELNSNYANAHHWYGIFLSWMGRHDEALAQLKRAQELDPLSLMINSNLGLVLYNAKEYDLAIEELQKALNLLPDFFHARSVLGLAYLAKGMQEQAIIEHEKAVALVKRQNPAIVARLGYAKAVAGARSEALEILDQLNQQRGQSYAPAYYIAAIHSGLGDQKAAVEWLEMAYKERDSFLPWLRGDPCFDPLRSDPRFQDLLRRINFPE